MKMIEHVYSITVRPFHVNNEGLVNYRFDVLRDDGQLEGSFTTIEKAREHQSYLMQYKRRRIELSNARSANQNGVADDT